MQVAFLIQYYDIKRFIFSTKKINLEKSNFGNLCPWEKGLVYTAISIVLAAVVIECGLSIDSLPPLLGQIVTDDPLVYTIEVTKGIFIHRKI